MKKEKVGKRWKPTADIFFRFNPERFGKTQKGLEPLSVGGKPLKGSLKKKNGEFGGPGGI